MRRAALLLAACILSASGAAAQGVPSGFVGSWKGTGSQSDQPGVKWTIALTLGDGEPHAVVGTITYPSLQCGGDLILRGGDGRGIELLERITFGECVDRGIITLMDARDAPGGLSYHWRDEAGLEARGTLSRAQPPAP
ncbi:MAG: hypothetical protein ACJ8J0_15570 [Longimicrobiaceae bacterium]